MATLALNVITRTGSSNEALVPATGGGDAMACGPANFLKVQNAGGSSITVTLPIPTAIQNAVWNSGTPFYNNPGITVTNGQARLIGPILAPIFADPTTGLCTITYSGVTSVTVGAFTMTPGV